MDFSNRNAGPQPTSPASHAASAASGSTKKKGSSDSGKWNRVITIVLVAAIVVLIGALIAFLSTGSIKSENKYVQSDKLQAVFLNTGQVYFGNIKSLNDKYFVLTNIYYLQTSNNGSSGGNAASNVTLVKLGCELHEPYDQMVVNADQVTFWENLQDNGQVAKAVKTFEQQNPQGQKCADQSSSASSNSSNSAQNASSNSSSGSNSSTTPTTSR